MTLEQLKTTTEQANAPMLTVIGIYSTLGIEGLANPKTEAEFNLLHQKMTMRAAANTARNAKCFFVQLTQEQYDKVKRSKPRDTAMWKALKALPSFRWL